MILCFQEGDAWSCCPHCSCSGMLPQKMHLGWDSVSAPLWQELSHGLILSGGAHTDPGMAQGTAGAAGQLYSLQGEQQKAEQMSVLFPIKLINIICE